MEALSSISRTGGVVDLDGILNFTGIVTIVVTVNVMSFCGTTRWVHVLDTAYSSPVLLHELFSSYFSSPTCLGDGMLSTD